MKVIYTKPEYSGEEIKQFMNDNGLSVVALGNILGIDKTMLIKYINGFTGDIVLNRQTHKLLYLIMQNPANIELLRKVEEEDGEDRDGV